MARSDGGVVAGVAMRWKVSARSSSVRRPVGKPMGGVVHGHPPERGVVCDCPADRRLGGDRFRLEGDRVLDAGGPSGPAAPKPVAVLAASAAMCDRSLRPWCSGEAEVAASAV